jgi:hypothetical protein
MTSKIILPAVAGLLMSTAAIAQQAPTDPAAPATPPAATSPSAAPTESPAATPSPSTPAPATTADSSAGPLLSDEQASALKNKVVWSSDQKNIGEVADVVRDSSGHVTELHADIGGFLGFGETRVRIAPDEFKVINDRVELTRTKDQAEKLPKVIEN